jgi:hypothetical protein
MAGIQSFLAIGAMAILALVSLRFNTNVLENSTVEIENKVYLTAFSLADDLIEEIKQKAFDERTIDFQAINVTQLTPAGSLDKESGEAWPNFDDVDDYKGYTKAVSLPHAEGYTVACDVKYVDSNGNNLTTQEFFKKVTVTVTSKYLKYPMFVSFIFSLHSKN